MAQSNFADCAKEWLSEYKRHILHVTKDGCFKYRGQIYYYPHILPKTKQKLNILPDFRDEFWKWFSGRGIPLRTYFHHLNSSQALSFNLFFPLLMENGRGLPTLLSSLNIVGSPAPGAGFEFIPCPAENTHFDFMLPLQSLGRVYFEVKYTESGFPAKRGDTEHLLKFNSVYKPRLAGRFEQSFWALLNFEWVMPHGG